MKILKTILLHMASIAMFFMASLGTYAQSKKIKTLLGENITEKKLTSEIKKIMEAEKIPGVSLAIINNNEIAYQQALGVSNVETNELITPKSIFEGASLSKPIFAYFVMKMAEKGKIDLDKPLFEYLPHPGIVPESQKDAKLITARMVLAHQAGFPNHADNKPIKLAFKPGEGFMYSGEAYQYLAAIIGMQNGVGWKAGLNTLFQDNVTKPLKMQHTTFVWDDYLAANKVYGHDKTGRPTANSPQPGGWSGETFNAFSSVHSEAGEYAKFIIAMLKQEGLKAETFDDMLKEHTHFKEDNSLKQETGQTGWGLGFAQKPTPNGIMHLHTGNNHDFQAYAMFIPEQKYGLVIFTNSDKMVSLLKGISVVLGPQF